MDWRIRKHQGGSNYLDSGWIRYDSSAADAPIIVYNIVHTIGNTADGGENGGHSKVDADKHKVLHITKEGKYEDKGYVFEIQKFEKEVRKFPKDSEYSAYVNLKNIPIDFEIRTRQDGDIIRPFGLNGTQKLKKYLNEKKIPNHEKENLLFMTQFNEVFWAIGLGISDKIKVTSKPTHHLTFYKKGQNNGN